MEEDTEWLVFTACVILMRAAKGKRLKAAVLAVKSHHMLRAQSAIIKAIQAATNGPQRLAASELLFSTVYRMTADQ